MTPWGKLNAARWGIRQDHPLARNLIGYWPVLAGGRTDISQADIHQSSLLTPFFADWSGNGHHLTPNASGNQPAFTPRYLADFDGTDDAVVSGYTNGIGRPGGPAEIDSDGTQQTYWRTMMIAFRLKSLGNMSELMGHGRNNSTYGISIRTSSVDQLYAFGKHNDSGSTNQIATGSSFLDTDFHVVAARFSTNGALVMDGEVAVTGTMPEGYPYSFGIGAATLSAANQYYPADMEVYCAYYAEGEVDDDGLKELTTDPFCLLHRRRPTYFLPSGDLRFINPPSPVTEANVTQQELQILLPEGVEWEE